MSSSLGTVGKQLRSGRFLPKSFRGHIHSLLFDRHVREMPDRKYFEQAVIPFLAELGIRNALYIGCRAYTSHYPLLFAERGITLYTCDIDRFSERYGAPGRHCTIDACALSPEAFPVAFDAVVFSGVIGFGVDTVSQIEKAASALATLLSPGSILVQGWNTDRSIDPLTNPVWLSLFARTRKRGIAKRKSFNGSTHVFDVLERRAGS